MVASHPHMLAGTGFAFVFGATAWIITSFIPIIGFGFTGVVGAAVIGFIIGAVGGIHIVSHLISSPE